MKNHFILWADEDEDNQALYRQVVQQVDPRALVLTAGDGGEVLACLNLVRKEKTFPCLIILNMNMPGLGGRETITLVRRESEFAAIPIVALSTLATLVERNFCDRFGVKLFTRPASTEDLKSLLQQLLTSCRCRQQKEPEVQSPA